MRTENTQVSLLPDNRPLRLQLGLDDVQRTRRDARYQSAARTRWYPGTSQSAWAGDSGTRGAPIMLLAVHLVWGRFKGVWRAASFPMSLILRLCAGI